MGFSPIKRQTLHIIHTAARCPVSHSSFPFFFVVLLSSVPCEPSNLQASLLCDSNSDAVTWEHASGAVVYQAEGIATDRHQVSCNASVTHCDLQDLHCGQIYFVSVFAEDQECRSQESASTHVRTGESNMRVCTHAHTHIHTNACTLPPHTHKYIHSHTCIQHTHSQREREREKGREREGL